MTGPEFVYPEQTDRETGAQYWARVRAMGLPYEWERDKAVPPGPITVDYEWWTRDAVGMGWQAADEAQARQRLIDEPAQVTLHRRPRWVAFGDWEDVPDA
jgi:hypothetical protein